MAARALFLFAACGTIAATKEIRVDIHLEAAPGSASMIGGVVSSRTSSASFLSGASAELDRDTQSPMVWLNLHKAGSQMRDASSSSKAYAAQKVADASVR